MKTRISAIVTFAILAIASLPGSGLAADAPEILKKVGFDQRLNQQVPLDLQFTDETGKSVKLRDYFGEKPVILVLAYYKCPMLCTLVLNGLTRGMREIPFTVGKEFNVVVVSFNPHETPDLAAKKKDTYLTSYGRPDAGRDWHFLTGKQDEITKLTEAVGFRYQYDAATDQYIHASGIMILTPSGKLSRYFYGIEYPGRDLRLGLVEASAEKIGSPTDQVLLYCFHYDPTTGKYTASVMNFIRVASIVTMVGLVCMILVMLKIEGRRRAAVG